MGRFLRLDLKSILFVVILTSINVLLYLILTNEEDGSEFKGWILSLISLIASAIAIGISIAQDRKKSN